MAITAFGKYEVIRKIGEGGFGQVYQGRDPHLNRLVAIKTCTSKDADLRRRFLREGEIAGRLQHPNITTVFAFDLEGDTPYLVQEFLDGEDLDHLIKRRQEVAATTKLGYLTQVAEGLRYAHTQDVVHRDIKPANIRVLEDGQVRIMDFGIAKLMSADLQLTQTGMTLGTAGYLPPEQLRGEPVDLRADLFSFGILAYELMTYERPFTGSNLSAILYAIAHQEPLPITQLWPGCPPTLGVMIATCLEKDPKKRYASFSEVLTILRPLAQTGGPQRAAVIPPPPPNLPPPPPSTAVDPLAKTMITGHTVGGGSPVAPHAGKRASNAPLVATTVALVLAVGIVGLWVIWSQFLRPEENPQETTTQGALSPTDETSSLESTAAPSVESTGGTSPPVPETLQPTTEPSPTSTTTPSTLPPPPGPPPSALHTEAPPPPVPVQSTSPTTPSHTPQVRPKPAEPATKPPTTPPTATTPATTTPVAPGTTAPPAADPLPVQLITNLPPGTTVGRLNQGQQAYADRDFRFATIPTAYRTLHHLRTLNEEKKEQNSITFRVTHAVEVFVAHDQQIRKKPDWLDSFRATGEELAVNEGGEELRVALYDVYSRSFPAGEVVLGPNTRPRTRGNQMSMYIVFVRPQ